MNTLLVRIAIFTCIFTLVSCSSVGKRDLNESSTQVYNKAQRDFSKGYYKDSLKLFKKFVDNHNDPKDRKRLFWAVDQAARIYLRFNKDPKSAILFLNSVLKKNLILSDADEDMGLQERLAAVEGGIGAVVFASGTSSIHTSNGATYPAKC